MMVLLACFVVFSVTPCLAAKSDKAERPVNDRIRHLTAFQKDIPKFVAFKAELEKFLGVPYRFGGVSLNGIDCSGFAKRLFAEAFGIELPHNSRAISRLRFLQDLPVDLEELRPSDLLFFDNSKKGRIDHVGISLGEDKFIHASRSKGVIVSSLRNSYWRRRLLASKRVTVLDDAQLMTMAASGPVEGMSGEAAGHGATARMLAVGYHHELYDDRLSFGVEGLYGDRSFKDAVEVDGVPGDGWRGLSGDHYQGWRARLDLRPSFWLRLTPWLGQMDVFDPASGAEGALGHYGVKTRIGAPSSPWSLSLAAQSTHFHDFCLPSGPLDEWRSLDLGLDFGYRFTPAASLSVSAWRSSLYEGAAEDPSMDRLSDVALRLKVEF